MSAAEILRQHDADAETIKGATHNVVGRLYAERRRRQQLLRYHRERIEELLA